MNILFSLKDGDMWLNGGDKMREQIGSLVCKYCLCR